jgi:hypothetical protein
MSWEPISSARAIDEEGCTNARSPAIRTMWRKNTLNLLDTFKNYDIGPTSTSLSEKTESGSRRIW